LVAAAVIAGPGCEGMTGPGSSRKALEKPAAPSVKLKGVQAEKHKKMLEQIESSDPRDLR
jgi:hypothetical protein